MCGICGELTFAAGAVVRPEVLTSMRERLLHRGPDDEGLFVAGSGRAGLAFRRLRIIDLSAAANQPMSNEDGTVRVVFNGEIYNFRELRAELEARGHRFRSHADTEVIVHLYEERGPAFVDAIDGMFAIAVWDDRAEPSRPRPRPRRQETAVLLPRRAAGGVRFGDQGAVRASRMCRCEIDDAADSWSVCARLRAASGDAVSRRAPGRTSDRGRDRARRPARGAPLLAARIPGRVRFRSSEPGGGARTRSPAC